MLVPTVSKEFSHTQWWTINLTLFVSKENGRKDCEKRGKDGGKIHSLVWRQQKGMERKLEMGSM
jgi:hypothetical protein